MASSILVLLLHRGTVVRCLLAVTNPRGRQPKMNTYKQLCSTYAVVLLQETHGNRCDVDAVSEEVPTHTHHLSIMPGRLAGGVIISVEKAYMKQFDFVELQVIEDGRVFVSSVSSARHCGCVDVPSS